MPEHPLEKHARNLQRQIRELGGNKTESTLRGDSYRHEELADEALTSKSALSHEARSEAYRKAANNVKAAKDAVKAYGKGHEMSKLGEGKPHK